MKTLGEYFVILTKEKKSPYIVTNNVKLIIHQEIDKIFSRTGKKTSGSVCRLPLNKTSKKACAVKQAKMTVKKILFSTTETRLLSKRLQLHGINFFSLWHHQGGIEQTRLFFPGFASAFFPDFIRLYTLGRTLELPRETISGRPVRTANSAYTSPRALLTYLVVFLGLFQSEVMS